MTDKFLFPYLYYIYIITYFLKNVKKNFSLVVIIYWIMVSLSFYIYIISYFYKFVNKNLCEFFHNLFPGFLRRATGPTFSTKSFLEPGSFEGRAVSGDRPAKGNRIRVMGFALGVPPILGKSDNGARRAILKNFLS